MGVLEEHGVDALDDGGQRLLREERHRFEVLEGGDPRLKHHTAQSAPETFREGQAVIRVGSYVLL